MPLALLTSPPPTISIEEHREQQTVTPAHFQVRPPVLRIQLQGVWCARPNLAPADPNPNANANGAPQPAAAEQGTLWVTDEAISFLPSSSSGWTLDYPSLSLHAISRSLPDALASLPDAATASGCIYCQVQDDVVDEAAQDADEGGEDDDDDEYEGGELKELWLMPKEGESLEPLFQALSQCAALHPSLLDNDDQETGGGLSGAATLGHPFSSVGPFGTGLNLGESGVEGAFDDAEGETEDGGGGGAGDQSGRNAAVLSHLEGLVDWSKIPGLGVTGIEDVEQDQDQYQQEGQLGVGTSKGAAFQRSEEARKPSSTSSSSPSKPSSVLPKQATKSQSQTTPSNTLHLTPLPSDFFDSTELIASLLDLLNAYGPLVSWTPMPGLGRAIVVFENEEGARRAKEGLDRLELPFEGTEDEGEGEVEEGVKRVVGEEKGSQVSLRALYGAPTRITYDPLLATSNSSGSEATHLVVPMTERNFLISPPGSPPVGWKPIREDPPNTDTLADDLIRALGELRDRGGNVSGFVPRPLEGEEVEEGDKDAGDDEARDASPFQDDQKDGESISATRTTTTTTKEGPSTTSTTSIPSSPSKSKSTRTGSSRPRTLPPPSLVIPPTSAPPPPRHPRASIKLPTASGEDDDGFISVPGLVVQSMDPEDEDEQEEEEEGGDGEGRGRKTQPPANALSISSVKATIESLRGRTPSSSPHRREMDVNESREGSKHLDTSLDPSLKLDIERTGAKEEREEEEGREKDDFMRLGGRGKRITPTGRPPLA